MIWFIFTYSYFSLSIYNRSSKNRKPSIYTTANHKYFPASNGIQDTINNNDMKMSIAILSIDGILDSHLRFRLILLSLCLAAGSLGSIPSTVQHTLNQSFSCCSRHVISHYFLSSSVKYPIII